jgi:hypothetical protein
MLTILGKPEGRKNSCCDGISRRGFLKIGGLAMGGLSLAQLLAVEAQARSGSSHKALINIYLPGGPSHLDLWDIKADAPSEVRGEFKPIKTNVPGIEICELFPRMARMMDKFVPIRTVVGSEGRHDAYQCMTGRSHNEAMPGGGWPAAGAYVSKLQGAVDPCIPGHVSLMYTVGNGPWGEPGTGGFVGPSHAPVSLIGKEGAGTSADMVLKGISLERLRDRHNLLDALDKFRRETDASGVVQGMDHFTQQAMSILTSSRLADALDLSKEDPRVVERYGKNDPTFQRDGAPRMIQNLLIARRLVEAGARVVSLNYSRWDWHGGDGMNFPQSREEFPLLDQGLSALVTDLHERGLDRDVNVWSELPYRRVPIPTRPGMQKKACDSVSELDPIE